MKAAYVERNREAILEARAAAYAANPSRHREWVKANPERHRLHQRKSYLKSKFGLTVAQFDAMLAAQDGRCAICHTDKPGLRAWHIDHCHDSNKVRGLLCKACNHGLGLFRDDPSRLLAAERYLQKNRTLRAAR